MLQARQQAQRLLAMAELRVFICAKRQNPVVRYAGADGERPYYSRLHGGEFYAMQSDSELLPCPQRIKRCDAQLQAPEKTLCASFRQSCARRYAARHPAFATTAKYARRLFVRQAAPNQKTRSRGRREQDSGGLPVAGRRSSHAPPRSCAPPSHVIEITIFIGAFHYKRQLTACSARARRPVPQRRF